jgi:hypothetical protein
MGILLWVATFVLMGCGWSLRSVARKFSQLSHRQKILLIVMYAVWAVVVMRLMLWIGDGRMDTVGTLFMPVILILSTLAAFSDDIGRLVHHVRTPKRND